MSFGIPETFALSINGFMQGICYHLSLCFTRKPLIRKDFPSRSLESLKGMAVLTQLVDNC